MGLNTSKWQAELLPALTAAVLALPAGRSVRHVGQLLLHLFLVSLLVDLVDGLGAGVLSPLYPVGLAQINHVL